MTTFVIVAALMAVLAAAAVALPLWRDRASRPIAVATAVCIVGVAAALYPAWSTWNWHAPMAAAAAGAPDVQAMVKKLESRLRDDPNDVTGWVMLGRSYVALERLDDAIVAYDHAHRLDLSNVDASLGLGEAMSLRAGGSITAPAGALFEQALTLEPGNAKALLYGGFAAAARGDTAAARARWQALKELHPPAQVEQMLDARIGELGAPAQSGAAQPAAAAATRDAAPPAEATLNIGIAPALKARLTAEAPLFIFASNPGERGPPLAAKRLTTAAIGSQIHLSSADSMIPGRTLASGRKVSITARVSFSGQPLPAAGDLFGEVTYDVGQDGARDLVIDHIAQ